MNEISNPTSIFGAYEHIRILPDVTVSQKFNIAAAKPEVLISWLPDEIQM